MATSAAHEQLVLQRAETGNALVTLHSLGSKPELNGAVVQLVANAVAPKPPSAGRVAVRLADDSIISVSVKNATAGGAPVGSRVSVGGDVVYLLHGDGWRVEQEYGVVTEVTTAGGVVVEIDSATGKAVNPRTVSLFFSKDCFLLEPTARRIVDLVNAASGWDSHAQTARDANATDEARTEAMKKLRDAADAAAKWLSLENHASMRCLAALTHLQLLRTLADAPVRIRNPSSDLAEVDPQLVSFALAILEEAEALMQRHELWSAFPTDLMGGLYREHCFLHLARPMLLLAHPAKRAPADGYELLMGGLFTASQYCDLASEAASRFVILGQMALCLTSFHKAGAPDSIGWPSPCWPTPEADAPKVGRVTPRDAGESLIKEIERACGQLERLAAGTDPLDCIPAREHASTVGLTEVVWMGHFASLMRARSSLRRWLDAPYVDSSPASQEQVDAETVDVCEVCT